MRTKRTSNGFEGGNVNRIEGGGKWKLSGNALTDVDIDELRGSQMYPGHSRSAFTYLDCELDFYLS